mgnify:CR=1 FL=1
MCRALDSERAAAAGLHAELASLRAAGDSAGAEASDARNRAAATEAALATARSAAEAAEARAAEAEARLAASEADRAKLADQVGGGGLGWGWRGWP